MKTKDFTERFLSTYKVNLDNLDIYTKNLALLVRYSCNIMVFIIVPFSEHLHKLLQHIPEIWEMDFYYIS